MTDTASEAPVDTTDDHGPTVWRLSPDEFEATQAKIGKINDRAAKRGFTGVWILDGTRVEVTKTNDVGFTSTEVYYDTTLTGTAPHYAGWTFLAALDWDPHAGLIVNTAPGVDNVDRTTLAKGECQHCNTVRANRRKTYVVSDGTRTLQVGSTCIKDFLGWTGTVVFLTEEKVEREADLGGFGGSGRDLSVDTETVLAVALAAIKTYGYQPSSSYNGSTANTVRTFLFDHTKVGKEVRKELESALEADLSERAAAVRAFVLSDDFTGMGSYVDNLKTLLAADFVSSRNIGYVASAPQAHAKHLERTLIRKAKAKALGGAKPSYHLGAEKEKITLTGTIVRVSYSEHAHGTTTIYKIVTPKGAIATWFSTTGALGEEEGIEVTLTATIKTLTEYQGQPETIITRAKRVDACPTPVPPA